MEVGIIAIIIIGCLVLMSLIGLLYCRLKSRNTKDTTEDGCPEIKMEASLPPISVVTHRCYDEEPLSPSVYSCRSFSDVHHTLDNFIMSSQNTTEQQLDVSDSYAFPECGKQQLKDWGPGLAICTECSARPIWNRGCGVCDKRMCQKCFDSHISLKVSVLELSKQTILRYGSLGGTLKYSDWIKVLTDLNLPLQSEVSFNSSTQQEGLSVDDLARLLCVLPDETTTALSKIIRPTAQCGSAEVAEFHDWGPGLATCSVCSSKPILNRGCRACLKKMCQKCFNQHIHLSQLYLSKKEPLPDEQLSSSFVADFDPSSKSVAKVMSEFNVLTPDGIKSLQSGGSLYYFSFQKGKLPDLQRIAKVINLTAFEDEMRDNCIPKIDPVTDDSCVYLLNKAVYLLQKGIRSDHITDRMIASTCYQTVCQPSGTKVLQADDSDTFRFQKTIVWPYKLTIQFKVSVIPSELYPELVSLHDNLPIHYAILLERTKRTKTSTDMIKKAKSILLYHNLNNGSGGVMVTNITAGAATSIPSIIAGIVDKLGSMGAKDVAETATNTRKYFIKNLPK